MKKSIFILLGFCIISCEETGELTQPQNFDMVSQAAVPQYQGSFVPASGITATGQVQIFLDGAAYKLIFNDLSVSDGPDLKVYLSKAATPLDFVNLGNFDEQGVYQIPVQVNIQDYSYVLVHCQQYNHLFAYAQLNQIPQ